MIVQKRPRYQPAQSLRAAVSEVIDPLEGPWQPLSGGRVNALWRIGDNVIKHFQPNCASPLFPNDPKAEAVALSFLAPYDIAPTLLAQGDGWLAYRFCPGNPWQTDTAMVANLMTRLHGFTPKSLPLRRGANGSTQLLAQAKAIAALCAKALPLPPVHVRVAPGPACLIHGDLVPGNIIVDGSQAILIDWQCPAIGDPAEDVATFLSPAMQFLYRGSALTTSEINIFRAACQPATLARYDQLAQLYHWRMAAHCLWRSERGATDYTQALELELTALQGVAQKDAG